MMPPDAANNMNRRIMIDDDAPDFYQLPTTRIESGVTRRGSLIRNHLLLSSNCASANQTAPRRVVRFNSATQLVGTKEEPNQDLWWTRQDINKFRQLSMMSARCQQRQQHLQTLPTSIFGLNTMEQEKTRKNKVRSAWKVVVDKKVMEQSQDPEYLSIVYWECTRQSQWEATQRGTRLAQQLQQEEQSKRQQCQPHLYSNSCNCDPVGSSRNEDTLIITRSKLSPYSAQRKRTIRVQRWTA